MRLCHVSRSMHRMCRSNAVLQVPIDSCKRSGNASKGKGAKVNLR